MSKLDEILELGGQIDDAEDFYREGRAKMRKDLAELIMVANEHDGIAITKIAEELGKTRQAVYKLLVEVYGVRHPNMIRHNATKSHA